ncbi:MAG: P-loop NTPase [Lentimicrobiaceae bacterium]|jgi:MinD superfamily P-loop ATPase
MTDLKPLKIAIASGKGGTGKTTLSTNLAAFIAEQDEFALVDLDVEEPNSGLFFKGELTHGEDTFTRVYNRALTKIAKAFVECLAIEIEGGQVEFEKQWYKCKKCFTLIDGLENHIWCNNCKSYGDTELVNLNELK